ncbi:MAG: AzlC family ABC transporter permease [Oscillospiraceae bacterium]|nr:AzlC family ABC transporter permease [Oscillospiraceae bacterium]
MEPQKQDAPKLTFVKGLRDGLPICLGYLSVSFTFGMMVVQKGYPGWMAVLISMTNLTSAGQFAGTELLMNGAMYLEIAVTTFVINIRYMLMSLSLSQKVESAMTLLQRMVLSFGITDEVFAVAMQQERDINSRYFAGLILTPYVGWAAGTLLGATATGFLPLSVRTALGIAIYGMFLAIIIPPARKSRPILLVVLLAAAMSCCFYWIPGLNQLSTGWVIIICAVAAAGFAAWKFPIKEESS